MKTINVELSPYGIEHAITQLIEYKQDLRTKTEDFVKALSEIGIDEIHSIVDWIPADQELNGYNISAVGPRMAQGGGTRMTINFSGTDVLFIEFSAGITFGTDSYPLPTGDGYGMGTYPGRGNWDNPDGWYYKDESDTLKHSYGNPAYMPMYHAREAMAIRIWSLARSIFGSG